MKNLKKIFNLDEEKIECALSNKEFCFWQGKKAENVLFLFISDVGTHGIYLVTSDTSPLPLFDSYFFVAITNISFLQFFIRLVIQMAFVCMVLP